MFTIKTPTKLMLSGEWAVLEADNPCIVLAIDRYVWAKIKHSNEKIIINAEDINLKNIQAVFQKNKLLLKSKLSAKQLQKISFVQNAIELTLQYLKYKKIFLKNFELFTSSKETLFSLPNGKTKKIGLGSSAAISVAVVSSILKLHGFNIKLKKSKSLIFKIASTSHFISQNSGSCFDIAASTFGKTIIYKRFDTKWLLNKIKNPKNICKIFEIDWPKLFIKKITLPPNFNLLVCWSTKSSNSKKMIFKINQFKKEKERLYFDIILRIKKITTQLIEAIKQQDKTNILRLIQCNQEELETLGCASKTNIQTKELAKAIKIAQQNNALAKISGSGGGDCAIAVCFNNNTTKKIKTEWEQAGLIPIDLNIIK